MEEQPTPLAQVAAIMAKMIDDPPHVVAVAEGTRVYVHSDGVTVLMNVLSVTADAEQVLDD